MPASPPPVRVRPARPEELDAVGRLTVAAYAADVPPGSTYAEHLADAAGRARHARLLVAVDPEERLLGTATLVVGGAEEPASPHQRLQVADVRLTAWPPTGDPRPGHPAGPSRIVPLAGRRLAGR